MTPLAAVLRSASSSFSSERRLARCYFHCFHEFRTTRGSSKSLSNTRESHHGGRMEGKRLRARRKRTMHVHTRQDFLFSAK
jgi:hypothetical protein